MLHTSLLKYALMRNGWKWGNFSRNPRIWMDLGLSEWGGTDWVSKICPVKGSSEHTLSNYANDQTWGWIPAMDL